MYTTKDLITLKPDKFEYAGRKYKQDRFITSDKKFLFHSDDLYFVSVFMAGEKGTACFQSSVYTHSRDVTPIYGMIDALAKINELGLTTEHELNIDSSQYKAKRKVK